MHACVGPVLIALPHSRHTLRAEPAALLLTSGRYERLALAVVRSMRAPRCVLLPSESIARPHRAGAAGPGPGVVLLPAAKHAAGAVLRDIAAAAAVIGPRVKSVRKESERTQLCRAGQYQYSGQVFCSIIIVLAIGETV